MSKISFFVLVAAYAGSGIVGPNWNIYWSESDKVPFPGLDKVTNVNRLTSTISIDFLYLLLSESLHQWCNKKYQMGQALENSKVDSEETIN